MLAANLAEMRMRGTLLANDNAQFSPALMQQEDGSCPSNHSNPVASNRDYFSQRCTFVSEMIKSSNENDECGDDQ